MSDTHLFLLVPNDSGSTWLQNNLTLCTHCVGFPGGRTGKGVGAGDDYENSTSYPNQEINKLFSENISLWEEPDAYNWTVIKDNWNRAWSQHEHWGAEGPRVLLEKSPAAIYASDMYVEHFDNVRFIIMTRNPYAVAEGMRRTIGREDVNIERCIKHWIRCAQRQISNYEKYKDISLELTYEELVLDPRGVEDKIRGFLPQLEDIDFTKAADAHALDGGIRPRPLVDYNDRQIKRLSCRDIHIINRELSKVPEILEHFGYEMIPSNIYTASKEQTDSDIAEFKKMDFPFRPFSLSDEQLLEIGRKVYLCLTPQDFPDHNHDYPIEHDNNKPWKYLKDLSLGTKVLFIGVGSGREVLCAKEMGLDAYGITMGSNNINFGREVLGLEEDRLVEGCTELLPYPPESFDVVAGFQIVEHAVSPLMFLLEMGRVLRPGGEIVLEWPAPSWHSSGGANPRSPQHNVCLTPGQCRAMLMKSGFDNVSLFYQDMTPIPEANWWQGEQEKGYIVAKAQKDTSELEHINRFRDLGKDQ
jgi:SAM-dependent methyltransferase